MRADPARIRRLQITGYAELLPELRRLAADPTITRTQAWRDHLHIGSRKLSELVDEHGLEWQENPRPNIMLDRTNVSRINAARQEKIRQQCEDLLPLIRQLAADPELNKRQALMQLPIGHKRLNRVLDEYRIPWTRPRPKYAQERKRGNRTMLNAKGENPAKDGAKAQQRTSRDQKTVNKLLGYMCPNLFGNLVQSTQGEQAVAD